MVDTMGWMDGFRNSETERRLTLLDGLMQRSLPFDNEFM